MRIRLSAACYFIAFLSLNNNYCYAQNEISFTPYNYSDVGRYVSLDYGFNISKKSMLKTGVLFHLNNTRIIPDRNQDLYLHHRFKAYETIEHFGLNLGYEYKVYSWLDSKLTLFAYDQLMLRRMGAFSYRHVPYDTVWETTPDGYYMEHEYSTIEYTHIKKLLSFENIIGFGIKGKFSNRLGVTMKAGLGFNYITNLPREIFKSGNVLQHSIQSSVGLYYSF